MQRSKRAKIYVDVWILEALSSAMTFFLAFFPCLFIKWCVREKTKCTYPVTTTTKSIMFHIFLR